MCSTPLTSSPFPLSASPSRDNRYIKRPSARTPFTHPWQHVPAVIRTTKHLWELGSRLFPMACPRLSHRVTGNRHPNIVSVAQKGFWKLAWITFCTQWKRSVFPCSKLWLAILQVAHILFRIGMRRNRASLEIFCKRRHEYLLVGGIKTTKTRNKS